MIKTKNENSRIVTVKRRIPQYANAQNQTEAKGYFNMASRTIGGYFKSNSKAMGKGMEFEEIKLLFPEIIGIEEDDRDFRRTVETWYSDIIHNVPPEGLSLEIGMTRDNSKPMIDYNAKDKKWVVYQTPISPVDYVKYMHIKGHPEVAETFQIGMATPSDICKFYIEDEAIEKLTKIKALKIKDEAAALYNKYKDDAGFQRQTLVLLGDDAYGLDKTDLQVAFRKKIENEDIRKLEQFVSVCKDELSNQMYLVRVFLKQGILKEEGTKILDSDNNKYYGESIREVAIELHKKGSEDILRLLKARQTLE